MMVIAAPFTPVTLARMRELAETLTADEVARELGWTRHWLTTVARQHGIRFQVLAVDDGIVPVPVELRVAAIEPFTDNENAVFAVLLNAVPGPGIPLPALAAKSHLKVSPTLDALTTMRGKLIRRGYMLKAKRGRGGGWVLHKIKRA